MTAPIDDIGPLSASSVRTYVPAARTATNRPGFPIVDYADTVVMRISPIGSRQHNVGVNNLFDEFYYEKPAAQGSFKAFYRVVQMVRPMRLGRMRGCRRLRIGRRHPLSSAATGQAASNVTRGCIDRFVQEDYFPDKVTIADAVISASLSSLVKVVSARAARRQPGGALRARPVRCAEA